MKTRTDEPPFPQHEAGYCECLPGGEVVCRLCPHECHVAEGKHGRCRSRVNRGGRLWTEAYGRVCALQVDPVEKKPLLHFHPGSRCLSVAAAGCNLSCLNCQNASISQASPSEVPGRELSPGDVARLAVQTGSPLVAYTYTEPLTYLEYVRLCPRLPGSRCEERARHGRLCQSPSACRPASASRCGQCRLEVIL